MTDDPQNPRLPDARPRVGTGAMTPPDLGYVAERAAQRAQRARATYDAAVARAVDALPLDTADAWRRAAEKARDLVEAERIAAERRAQAGIPDDPPADAPAPVDAAPVVIAFVCPTCRATLDVDLSDAAAIRVYVDGPPRCTGRAFHDHDETPMIREQPMRADVPELGGALRPVDDEDGPDHAGDPTADYRGPDGVLGNDFPDRGW